MPRRYFSTLTAEEVRGLLREAELAVAGGGIYISGGAADVSWAKFREVPAQRLVALLQRELAVIGDDDRYPASDYIGVEQTRPDFS